MAVQQGNDELAKQALQRKQQYVQAATELETQLKQQQEATVGPETNDLLILSQKYKKLIPKSNY